MSVHVDRGDTRKVCAPVCGWLEERLISAVVRKSLQANLIKVVVCVLASINLFNSPTTSVDL